MSPPLIHLGAVTYSHNNTPYAIRGEVSFDFRQNSRITSIRLSPLTQPESPDAVPAAIDVRLLGRWQTALYQLHKRSIVEIQNASVKRSNDADINPVLLELADPPSRSVAVYTLGNDMIPVKWVSAVSLGDGLQPCPRAIVTSFRGRSAPWARPAQPERHTRVTIADAPRDYQYTPIGILSNPEGPIPYDPMKKFNVFGVVIECRAPSIAKTGSLRSEIVIADESSAVGIEPGDTLKSIAVFTFESNPKDAIPFRAIGDVVRVHRVHLKEFNVHGDGERRRSAQAKFYSSIVLWEYEGTDFLPFTTREPIRQHSAEHRISVQDRNRVRELRKWAKEYIFKYHTIPRPRLVTPKEILRAPSTTLWLSHTSVDVLCVVERDAFIDDAGGILTFFVADGFPNGNHISRIAVQSEAMEIGDHQYDDYSFVQFCPSWRVRPVGRNAWVVLRDVTIGRRNGERVILLHAGRRTSSIIWNSEGSPDYRNVKSRFGETEMPPQPSSTVNPASVNHGYGYSETTTPPAPAQAHLEPEPQPNERPGPPSSHVVPNSVPPSNGKHPADSNAERQSSPKRPRPGGILRALLSPGKEPKSSSPNVERREAGTRDKPAAQPFDEMTLRSMPLRRELTIITENEHADIPFSSIAGMLKTLREGNTGAHRLKVTARACSSPNDVRFACKPWCNRCNKYLKIDASNGRLECVTCSDTFSGTRDPKTTWTYSVKLVLEDSGGGRIEGWVEGNEGTSFFSGLAPTNLLINPAARRRVSKTLQTVLASKNRLDCSVKPYEYEDKQGFYRVACKIFATKLLPQYVANDNKD